jgi:nitrile hydratase beta subunit
MNGIHDLGGMHGFGPVTVEADEPVFHADWEKTVFAGFAQLAGQGLFNLDEFRHAIERMGNARYLTSSYYEHWLSAYETLLVEKGIVDGEELRRRASQLSEDPESIPRPQPQGDERLAPRVRTLIQRGASTARRVEAPPRFRVGDRVVTRVTNPRGHTRLPRYIRGKRGTVEMVHGAFVLPDTNSRLEGENPQYVYSVRFEADEVWGEHADGGRSAIYVDLWESYLEPAAEAGRAR